VTTQPRLLSRPQLAAVVAGNALEFYDFLVFGIFAGQIGAIFFPGQLPTRQLFLTLATAGVGFLGRPFGGLILGPLGDRIGRKPAMLFSFGLMGGSIVGLALTPSYAAIGVAAPILVVVFRLLQGFALGGEVGPTTAFLTEAAPRGRRCFYVALQFATQQAATVGAAIVGVILSNLLAPDNLNAWGWRVAMLLGAAVVPFALVMRRRLPETLEAEAARSKHRPTRKEIVLGLLTIVMLASATIATYTLIYINLFATHTLGLSTAVGFGALLVGGGCGIIFNLLGGWLSDRFGRKPLMVGGYGLLCIVGLPCFLLMSHWRTPLTLYPGTALMAALLGLGTPAIMCSLMESLPPQMRSGGSGIVYAFAIAIFGGSAQPVVAWLTDLTGSPLAPAGYMCVALALGVLAMLGIRETAPSRK
jgi:MHS family citrate/tricarballylate:H+ symporter-like MFS transporter